ncbi:protein of unknown function [Micropruina glycogenica]|uniref:Uncharacterized protein n=1 Tax=Micropruina glycogenica TaxID=75385 RepID=A0A2N9JF58_9ACTN|nr:protein of unknown function [Micropruina glycogenica]
MLLGGDIGLATGTSALPLTRTRQIVLISGAATPRGRLQSAVPVASSNQDGAFEIL